MPTDVIDNDRGSDLSASIAAPRKRSVWKLFLLALVVIIASLAAVVAMQPNEFRVSRSATMSAAPAAVFAQVNDFHRWENWSPWVKMDPEAKLSYEGPTSGEGAKFSWDGNSDVGAGSMTIVESQPSERIGIKLDFVRPFAGTSATLFTFEPQGDETKVTWNMAGENNFIAKAIGLVIDCDKMVGEQFEIGLAKMKTIAEAAE
jgi:hypothetical protein